MKKWAFVEQLSETFLADLGLFCRFSPRAKFVIVTWWAARIRNFAGRNSRSVQWQPHPCYTRNLNSNRLRQDTAAAQRTLFRETNENGYETFYWDGLRGKKKNAWASPSVTFFRGFSNNHRSLRGRRLKGRERGQNERARLSPRVPCALVFLRAHSFNPLSLLFWSLPRRL